MKDSFYITTAIDYANGVPHLGHAYEKVLTDVIARHHRLIGDEVYFLTGLDEHGQKVQQTVERAGIEPLAFCDDVAAKFQDVCKRLLISNDDYIRTTEQRHKDVVSSILQMLYDKGDIYQGEYHGFYSVRQEQFVQEKDKVNGEWPEIFGEVTEITENNYFFKLARHQDWLIEYIKEHDDFIFPRFRANQVMEFLKEPINDLCISRPKERLSWGIPLPFDDEYVTFVWFDALINYISAIGYGTDAFAKRWPADFHVIGKDILVPPHSVYWPIMLKACDIELPKSILAHGWWLTHGGGKMSKSDGNVVDPMDLIDQFGPDAFRYFVTREMNVGQDSEFTLELFMSRYNSDLANDLGNLVSRILNMGARYCSGEVPEIGIQEEPEKDLVDSFNETKDKVLELYGGLQFHQALDKTFAFIRNINRYAEIRAPWKLAKSDDPKDKELVNTAIGTMAEGLRLGAALLAPVMPGVTNKIYELLGLEELTLWEGQLEWSAGLAGNSLGEKTVLFPKPQK